MKLNKKQGFTLLEIIIVVIIVGVLASLALPRLFQTIEQSRSSEAQKAIGILRGDSGMHGCFQRSNTYVGCTLATLGVADPGNEPGALFSYAISGQSATGYVITATRNSLNGGTSGDTIVFTQSSTGVTRTGTGAFTGIN